MVQFIPRGPSFGEQLGQSIGQGANAALQIIGQMMQEKQKQNRLSELLGIGKQTQMGDQLAGQPPTGSSNFSNLPSQNKIALAMEFPEVAREVREQEKEAGKERRHKETLAKERIDKSLKEADTTRSSLPGKKMSLQLFRNAIQEGNVGYFSKSNLAQVLNNLTGDKFALKPDASGSQLQFAGKNYLIENLNRVGAKGLNQYLEKQISQAQPEIGKSREANMSVLAPMEAAYDIEKDFLDRLSNYEDMYEAMGQPMPPAVYRKAQKESADFADSRMKQLAYELAEIQETKLSDQQLMDFGTTEHPKNVTAGTPLTERRATLFLKKYGFDPENPESEKSQKAIDIALKVAKQLGYELEYIE